MDSELDKLAKEYPKKTCPQCKERTGAHIIYGYPVGEMFELEQKGHVVLESCVLPLADEPYYKYQCTQCDHRWE